MRTVLALALALIVSLLGNAWQWQRGSANKAVAKGEAVRLFDVARSNDDALAIVTARMWELAGESAQLEIATSRAGTARAAIETLLIAERRQHAKDLADAYTHDDVRDWGAQPVPARISRLYTSGGGTHADDRGAGRAR